MPSRKYLCIIDDITGPGNPISSTLSAHFFRKAKILSNSSRHSLLKHEEWRCCKINGGSWSDFFIWILLQQTWLLFMEARNLSEIKHFHGKRLWNAPRERTKKTTRVKSLSRRNKPDEIKIVDCKDDAKICNFYNPEKRSKHDKTAMKVSRLNRKWKICIFSLFGF